MERVGMEGKWGEGRGDVWWDKRIWQEKGNQGLIPVTVK